MKQILGATLVAMLLASPAMAACPAAVPGNSVEAMEINRIRVLCLQQQTTNDAQIRSLELDIQMLQMKQQHMDLQRRLDKIPRYEPPQIVFPRD